MAMDRREEETTRHGAPDASLPYKQNPLEVYVEGLETRIALLETSIDTLGTLTASDGWAG